MRETFSAEVRSIGKWVLLRSGHTAYCLFYLGIVKSVMALAINENGEELFPRKHRQFERDTRISKWHCHRTD